MKKLSIALIMVLFSLNAKSQYENLDSFKFVFSEVINLNDINSEQLYSNAKLFIAKEFVSGRHVTQLNDDKAHSLVVKSFFTTNPIKKLPFSFSYIKIFESPFTLLIECKDGKYRYTVDGMDQDLSLPYIPQKGEVGKKSHKELLEIRKESILKCVNLFIASLKNAMENKSSDF